MDFIINILSTPLFTTATPFNSPMLSPTIITIGAALPFIFLIVAAAIAIYKMAKTI